MGWKAWDAYEREANNQWRALPWSKRYNWRAVHHHGCAFNIGMVLMGKDCALKFLLWLLLALVTLSGPTLAAPINSEDIHVIDGDTIRLHHAKPDVRLVGFNAPETRRAKCDSERELGDKATRRVRDLVKGGHLDFEFVACACAPGSEGTFACNYGRRCGTLNVGSKDIGAILISENLAVPFICGATRCPKTPSPWCQPNR
jgi:endonuclease YncB( thermonuclease family)